MATLSTEEISKLLHSPCHLAVARRDHTTLRRILASVPLPAKAGEVRTEDQSVLAEQRADEASAVIDRRDVPGRETPLHLAVKLGDAEAVEMLMAAGADWSLQNEHGWSALQEAVCAREDAIAMIITRYYQPMAWAKWCRRLPRLTGAMRRMRDFYMELTFHFESSVIPFIGRIAPSDTYRIWKRGSNLRADMTLAGFDGFRIHRSDQSFLFLGDGSEDGKLPAGSLCVLSHKEKEVMNALEGAGVQPSEAEVAQEVAAMSQTNMYRPGIDVTQAELVSHLTWRRQERTEMVGAWKAKIYDMHHVMVSVRSRRVPGAMTDEELFAVEGDRNEPADFDEDYTDVLTTEEKLQLESALRRDNFDFGDEVSFEDGPGRPSKAGLQNGGYDSFEDDLEGPEDEYGFHSTPSPFVERHEYNETTLASANGNNHSNEKKGWFGWGRKSVKVERKNVAPVLEERASSSAETPRRVQRQPYREPTGGRRSVDIRGSERQLELMESRGRHSVDVCAGRRASVDRRASSYVREDGNLIPSRGKDKPSKKPIKEPIRRRNKTEASHESEYKKGLRPVLWLTPDFPLQTEELLPLLDILANKVKAVRRLRELLTTKMPNGTFPVKVAIPVVPTIRVVITFTKFEELKSSEEFSTPVSSPGHFQDSKEKEGDAPNMPGATWFSWMRGSQNQAANGALDMEDQIEEELDPFQIPSDYIWVDMNEKKRRMKEKKGKTKKGKKPVSSRRDLESDNDATL